jgi:hypothetical protein
MPARAREGDSRVTVAAIRRGAAAAEARGGAYSSPSASTTEAGGVTRSLP